MKLSFFLLFVLTSQSLFSQNTEVSFIDGIVIIKNIDFILKDTVFNNKIYKFPEDWKIDMGSDSILIAYPHSWKSIEGSDGHLVAFPDTWKAVKSPDGRIIAFPYMEEVVTIRKKIENCTYSDTSKCYSNIEQKINKFGIYTQTGNDKRSVIYTNEMTLSEGPDGRLVNIPHNWEVSQSENGRLSAYPKNWSAYEVDNRQFAMPEDWEIDFDTDSPEIIIDDKTIKFIFTPVEKYEQGKYIYNQDKENGLDYLIYLLVNQ
jgi:hypothetical protein